MTPDRLPDRMRKKIIMSGNCWEWTGCVLRDGYGRVGVGAKSRLAHRSVYELLVGPIPEGLTIDHLCRNTKCVNPAHLEPVTMRENVLRGVTCASAVNRKKTHCPLGHAYDDANTRVQDGRRYCRACDRVRWPEKRWRAEIARLAGAEGK